MERKIKVLHVSQSLGGVETHLKLLISSIDSSKFEHSIIIPSEANSSIIQFLNEHQISFYPIKFKRGFHPIFDLTAFYNIVYYCIVLKPDIVHLHSSKAGLLGRIATKLMGIPSIFTPHGISYLSMVGMKHWFFFGIECFAKIFTKRIVAVSYSEFNRLVYEIGFQPSQITVIKNSLPETGLEIQSNKDKNGPFVIGTVARITQQKNPLLFLEIVKLYSERNQNVVFKYLGAGLHDHLISEFNDYIKTHNLSKFIEVIPWGSVSIADFYNSLDAFALTSIFEAGMPYVVLEAMSFDVPCVTSKCDGCVDGIEHDTNGYLCITAKEFVDCLENLSLSPDKRKQISMHARMTLKQNYNLNKNILLHENLYRQCI